MKKAAQYFQKWRQKQIFTYMVETLDERLLLDAGFTPDVIESRLKTPFWKF